MRRVIEFSARCAACKQHGGELSVKRPELCRPCAEAADVAEVLSETTYDMTEAQYNLVMAALNRLETDAAAFAVIRRYAALLNGDVATILFLGPDRVHDICILPSPGVFSPSGDC